MIMCQAKLKDGTDCFYPATFRYTLPGHTEAFCCDWHSWEMVAEAMQIRHQTGISTLLIRLTPADHEQYERAAPA